MPSRANRVRVFEKDPVLYNDGWERIWGKKANVSQSVERGSCKAQDACPSHAVGSNLLNLREKDGILDD